MRSTIVGALLAVTASATAFTQAPSSPTALTFDVVSIKRNTSGAVGSNGSSERPDGSVTLRNIPISTLIARGYPDNIPIPVTLMWGLPEWAKPGGEYYDIIAKSPLSRPVTPEERTAMVRAVLADRFKLAVHTERREQTRYDLVFARGDHRLGPNIKPSAPGCEEKLAAERAEMEAAFAAGRRPPLRPLPGRDGNLAPCVAYTMGMSPDGDITLPLLATTLALPVRRPVTDRTGLTGSYRIKLTFDMSAAFRGPEVAPDLDAPPAIFTALEDQLGLKLESIKIVRDTLVIDHIERPTED